MSAAFIERDWYGCYDDSWKGVCAPAAMVHPAKFAFGLASRLIDHGFVRLWWKHGSRIGDPFAGVACGAILAAYAGLRWFGVELEAPFVELAQINLAKHRPAWEALGNFLPEIVQGDSRQFAGIVSNLAGIISSPPFSGTEQPCTNQATALKDYGNFTHGERTCRNHLLSEGRAGQIGGLRMGDLDAVIASPPYGGNEKSDYQLSADGKTRARDERRGYRQGAGCYRGSETYGRTPGQIGLLPTESDTVEETYWSACAKVYASCLEALRPEGVLCLVVKDYISKGQRVPLCGQTLRLLTAIGFRPLERIRCWQVKETIEPGLFGEVKTTKQRKSYFRQLLEAKGAPRIDFEEILIVKKDGQR